MSRGRYAPSPTGDLHLGNARTALVAWWRSRGAGSSFVMRVEDLDEPRTVPAAVPGNLDELRWLGIDWDEGPDVGGAHAPYRQSQRHALYERALAELADREAVFECYLSRRELRELSSAPHGATPVYGEQERRRNRLVRERKRAQGKRPALRLQAEETELRFHDALHGEVVFEAASEVGDVVLRRADGAWAYQFAVVVDDLEMGIEEVVRGDDLLHSTAAQLLVYRALRREPPAFMHVPLLLDESGERLAKRRGSLTLSALRSSGVTAAKVVGLLAATLGFLERPEPLEAAEFLSIASLDQLRREPHALTPEELRWLGL
ncbi:MAG TPA: tRNA glutamyl-Q(34) synthetase GluQRS [Trueperaceae bacterium]